MILLDSRPTDTQPTVLSRVHGLLVSRPDVAVGVTGARAVVLAESTVAAA